MSETLDKIIDAYNAKEAHRLIGQGLKWEWDKSQDVKLGELCANYENMLTIDNLMKVAEEVAKHKETILNNAKDVLRYRHLGIKYLRWLGVKDPIAGISRDIRDPEMFENYLLGPKP